MSSPLSLTKKQVKALLEVIGSDETRPVLMHAKIDLLNDKPVLVATDGYVLCALALSDAMTTEVGKFVPRAELVKWYKLANAKDTLTEPELLAITVKDAGAKYPEWQPLIPAEDKLEADTALYVNAHFMSNLQTLADANGLIWEFFGKTAPVMAETDDGSIYIVMPMKR